MEVGMEASEFGTRDAYRAAFLQLAREGLSPKQRDLFSKHYSALGHTITWEDLAIGVGYANRNAVQLQYGTLARRLANHLGIDKAPRADHFIGEFWGYVLCDPSRKRDRLGHTAYTLRPEVIAVLEELKWVT
jgi:hypothetical protein